MKNTVNRFWITALAAALVIMAACVNDTTLNTDTDRDEDTEPKEIPGMVFIPGGIFRMGRIKDSETGYFGERPVHEVTISAFYMGKYEVTQEQYKVIMETNPSNFTAEKGQATAAGEVEVKRPVETVSWYDSVEFCNALSIKEGLMPVYTISGRVPASGYPITHATVKADFNANGYRLPTEAEWEYAAKGGNGSPGNYTYSGSDTIDDVAWYDENSDSMTHEAGKLRANSLGLYDMSGNVYEWCWDWYKDYTEDTQKNPVGASSGTNRVFRGGSWYFLAGFARSAFRNYVNPSYQYDYIGFRLARSRF